uniref:Sin3 histone deacetylase corepressor complex component SDS3 n=1 Tax=Trichogramma kaykai TaxID=54128 RepID=A0ABD2WMU7_9HYME
MHGNKTEEDDDDFFSRVKIKTEEEDDDLISLDFVERDESDEDTEEASESERGKTEEYPEIKEQIYQDKLATLNRQLQQLKDGVHPEYCRRLCKLEAMYQERLKMNIMGVAYLRSCVERDYALDMQAAKNHYEQKKSETLQKMIDKLLDSRKAIEADRYAIELTGDSTESKPIMTRKLRRRPNEPLPEKPEKRRKVLAPQVNYLLDEKEIEADLKAIMSGRNLSSIKKPTIIQNTSPVPNPQYNPPAGPPIETKIEDGKLLYEKRWYHRGQPVFVEGQFMPKYSAIISAVGTEAVFVKKLTDNTKHRIFLNQLSSGTMTIKRRS